MNDGLPYPAIDDAIDLYEHQLKAFGVTPDTDRSDVATNIGFTYDDETFYLELDNADLQNVRFTLAFAIAPELKGDRAKLLEAALENTTACTAVATLIDEESDVVFRYDAFIGPDLNVAPLLRRILDTLQSAQDRFFTKMGTGA